MSGRRGERMIQDSRPELGDIAGPLEAGGGALPAEAARSVGIVRWDGKG
jgi:hypothetical protein